MILTHQKLLKYLDKPNSNIEDCCAIFQCSKTTVKNKLKEFSLATPRGFYSTGKKLGRPKGIPMSNAQKLLLADKFAGEGNPFHGRTHSKKTRKQMSKNHADFSGTNNPFLISLLEDETKIEAHKQRCLEIWANRDAEYRKRFGTKLSKALSESKAFDDSCFHKNHKCGHHKSEKCNRSVFYRSSWERRMCEALDKDQTVVNWSLEEYCVPYETDGKQKFTRIDFLIQYFDSQKMIEVKPLGLQQYKNNKIKIEALKNHCDNNNMMFEVFSLKEIEDYERSITLN